MASTSPRRAGEGTLRERERGHARPCPLNRSRPISAHDKWRNFGDQIDKHPPMRGWLAVPPIGSDGENYGFIQASDRLEGEFTEQDEANLVRLAALTSTALDALAQPICPTTGGRLSRGHPADVGTIRLSEAPSCASARSLGPTLLLRQTMAPQCYV
jgi:hypothetical protein